MADKINLKDVTPEAMAAMVKTSADNMALERCLRDAMRLATASNGNLEAMANVEQAKEAGITNLTFAGNANMMSNVVSFIGSAIQEKAEDHMTLNKICNSVYEPEVLAAVVGEAEAREGGR